MVANEWCYSSNALRLLSSVTILSIYQSENQYKELLERTSGY